MTRRPTRPTRTGRCRDARGRTAWPWTRRPIDSSRLSKQGSRRREYRYRRRRGDAADRRGHRRRGVRSKAQAGFQLEIVKARYPSSPRNRPTNLWRCPRSKPGSEPAPWRSIRKAAGSISSRPISRRTQTRRIRPAAQICNYSWHGQAAVPGSGKRAALKQEIFTPFLVIRPFAGMTRLFEEWV